MKRMAKFLVALAGAATQIVSLGILSGNAKGVATSLVSLLTAVAVFLVPNSTPLHQAGTST